MKFILTIVFMLFHSTPASAEHEIFTPASRGFLKEIDRIITYSSSKFNKHNRGNNYNLPLTKALVNSIHEEEENAIRINCGGTHSPGDLCGLAYDPIICAQDIPPIYFYNIDDQEESNAIVYVSAYEDGRNANKYNFIHDKDGWKIDSISCYKSNSFNDW